MANLSKVVLFRETTPAPRAVGQHVCVVGNLSDGYKVHGPFESFDEAAHWHDYKSGLQHTDCWIMELHVPEIEDNTN